MSTMEFLWFLFGFFCGASVLFAMVLVVALTPPRFGPFK